MFKKISLCLFIILFLFIGSVTWGVDFVWDGGGDGSTWTDVDNWDIGVSYPATNADTATFLDVTPGTTSIPGGITLDSLTIGTGSVITASGVFSLDNALTCNGTFTSAAAGISIGGNLLGTGTFNASSGTSTFSAGIGISTYNHNNGLEVFDGTGIVADT